MPKMNGLTTNTQIIQPLTEELLAEIVRRIVEGAHPERIILFGSYAYGTPTKDSDVDLIIVKRDVESKRKESVRIRKLLRGILLPFDIIVVRSEEFEFYKDEPGSVFKEVFRKGVVIYDAETMADLPSEG
jgi:predicted nucleotidyltransferase